MSIAPAAGLTLGGGGGNPVCANSTTGNASADAPANTAAQVLNPFMISPFLSEFHRPLDRGPRGDRKSTRLNSSHITISYAVFCLKKKKKTTHVWWCGCSWLKAGPRTGLVGDGKERAVPTGVGSTRCESDCSLGSARRISRRV